MMRNRDDNQAKFTNLYLGKDTKEEYQPIIDTIKKTLGIKQFVLNAMRRFVDAEHRLSISDETKRLAYSGDQGAMVNVAMSTVMFMQDPSLRPVVFKDTNNDVTISSSLEDTQVQLSFLYENGVYNRAYIHHTRTSVSLGSFFNNITMYDIPKK